MRSIRKISLLAAVVAVAIAVAAPAAASAFKLEYPNGENVGLGAALTLQSNNMRIQGPAGYWSTCSSVTIPAYVVENNATSATVEDKGPASTEWCFYREQSRPIKIELIDLNFTGSTTGTIELKLSQDWGKGLICNREGTLPMTFTPGTSEFHVNGVFPGEWCLTERWFQGDFSVKYPYPAPGVPIIIN